MCHTSKTFWFLTFFVIAQWNVYVTAQRTYLCNDNIVVMSSNNRERNRCNHVSTHTATWDQAWDYCHARGGWMVNCPSCSEGQGAYIGEELLAYNGVANIWSGLHIKSDRLLEDSFPTPEAMGQLREGWNGTDALMGGGRCVLEEFFDFDCGEGIDGSATGPFNIEKPPPLETDTDILQPDMRRRKRKRRRRRRRSTLPEEIPDNCLPIYKQRIVPCDESHTFSCYFSGINAFFFMTSMGVSDDLVLFINGDLDRRFFLSKVRGHLDQGDGICDKTFKGSRALRSRSDSSHRVILRALSSAVQARVLEDGMGMSMDDLKRTLFWYHPHQEELEGDGDGGMLPPPIKDIDGGLPGDYDGQDKYQGGEACKAALLSFSYSGSEGDGSPDEGDNFATMTWPCIASLPFLCEIPLDKGETPAPVVTARVIPDLQTRIKVVGNEVQVPFNVVGFGFELVCNIPPGFSELQSVTVYMNGQPVLTQQYNVEMTDLVRIPRPVDVNPIQQMNLYHCQVNNKADNRLINSNQMFVRVQEYTVYALHIGVNQSRQHKALWDQVYQASLAGDLAKFSSPNQPTLEPGASLPTNVFTRLGEAIEETDQWQMDLVDLIVSPTPRLVMYIFTFAQLENAEIDFGEEGLPTGDFENTGLDRDPDLAVQVDCKDCPNGQRQVEETQRTMTGILSGFRLPELNLNDIRVYSIDSCWPKNITVDSVGRTYSLPESPGGAVWTSPQTCAQDGAPLVVVECEGSKRRGFDWGLESVNPLCDYQSDVMMDSRITDDLKTVSQENVTKENVDEILERTKELTDQVTDAEIQPIDVTLIADILQKSSEVIDLTSDQANEILVTATRLTNLDGDVLEESQKIGKAATRVIKSVDDLGASVQVSDSSKFSRLVTDNMGLEVWDVTEGYDRNTIVGLKVLSDGNGEVIDINDLISLFSPSSLDYGEAEAAILLPKEFIESQLGRASQNVSVRLAMNVYADTSLYRATQGMGRNASLNSKVIAAKVLVNGIPITDLGPYNVTTVFLPKVKVPKEDRTRYSTCAWWDFEANDGDGAWSARGCSYVRTESDRDVCVCDHLTNFAILVSFYDQDSIDEDHDLALGIISIVGLVLSIIGLSLSILSFLCIKKLRQGRPQQTLFNLSVALLLSWVVFLAGIGRTENHAGCIAVAAILHYLIMTSFMWMLMEGILQYLLFVRVMNTYFNNYMVKTSVPAWGLPVIPVLIVLAIDPELYRGGENYCWMSLDAFYYAFALPVGAIILTNLTIFVMVVFSLCRRKDMTKHSSQNNSQAFVNFRASFICFFILGLSWIFGFLTIEDARTVFQYVFCVSASLQGFVIFLMMTARDKTVRAYWKDLCCGVCVGDSQKGKTYRTWGDKGTGSSSSGVQPVARHNKTYLDNTTSQTNLSSSGIEHTTSDSRSNPGTFPMGVNKKGYGSEESDLDNVHFTVVGDEEAAHGDTQINQSELMEY